MDNIYSHSPIVKHIVLSVLSKNVSIDQRKKFTINTDLVPKLSSGIMNKNSGFKESRIVPPIHNQKKSNIQTQYQPKIKSIKTNIIPEGYGKLSTLMRDPMVNYIECQGPDTPIIVVKNNQKQQTNITMNYDEMRSFFNYVSEKSKIPIMDGVFRVVVDDNLFNAIISEEIGTKFIIKRNVK